MSDVYSPWKFAHLIPELQKIKKGKIIKPLNMQLDLTNKCNFRCTFCYYHIHKHLDEFNYNDTLTEKEAIAIVGSACSYGIKSLEITGGGEPLIVPYFAKLSKFARKKGLERALVTNGVYLEKYVDEVKDYSWVRVSLDAVTPSIYEKVHCVPRMNLRKVKNGLEALCKVKDKDCIVGVSIVVNDQNWKDIVKSANYAKQIGANNIRISLAHTPRGAEMFNCFWEDICEEIERAKELQTNDFRVFSFSNRINDIEGKTRGGFCFYHHFTIAVGANGCLYPCCYFKYIPEYNLGNLKQNSFKSIWGNKKRKRFINTIAKDCHGSCWMTGKNHFARYLVTTEVPHKNFP